MNEGHAPERTVELYHKEGVEAIIAERDNLVGQLNAEIKRSLLLNNEILKAEELLDMANQRSQEWAGKSDDNLNRAILAETARDNLGHALQSLCEASDGHPASVEQRSKAWALIEKWEGAK